MLCESRMRQTGGELLDRIKQKVIESKRYHRRMLEEKLHYCKRQITMVTNTKNRLWIKLHYCARADNRGTEHQSGTESVE